MNLPNTYRPITIDTKSGNPPRAPIMTPGGGGFFCPCCTGGMPMEQKTNGPKTAIFVCRLCDSVLEAAIVPGVNKSGTMSFNPIRKPNA